MILTDTDIRYLQKKPIYRLSDMPSLVNIKCSRYTSRTISDKYSGCDIVQKKRPVSTKGG